MSNSEILVCNDEYYGWYRNEEIYDDDNDGDFITYTALEASNWKNSNLEPTYTWEQVFEWFRNKVNLSYSITHKVYYRRKREGELAFGVAFPIDEDRVGWTYEFKSDLPCDINFNLFDKSRLFNTYEEARLELVKLLIKLYGKKK